MQGLMKCTAVVAVMIALSACAPKRLALSVPARKEIKSTHVVLNSTQHDIVVQQNAIGNKELPDQHAPMDAGALVRPRHDMTIYQGGVLGALVQGVIYDSIELSAIKRARKDLEPVRASLTNFNFMHYFKGQLRGSLNRITWLNTRGHSLRYDIKESETKLVMAQKQNSTLLVGVTYAMNQTFNRLEVVAYVKLDKKVPGEKGSTGDVKGLYHNKITYLYRLHVKDLGKVSNIQEWVTHNGALLKYKLRQSAEMIARVLRKDISNPEPKAYITGKPLVIRTLSSSRSDAFFIRRDNDMTVAALKRGYIYIVGNKSIQKWK